MFKRIEVSLFKKVKLKTWQISTFLQNMRFFKKQNLHLAQVF